MKKILSFILSFVMVFGTLISAPVTVSAASIDVLVFELNEDGTGYTVVDCKTSAKGEVAIPETYNDLPVTCIGRTAFYECSRITAVSIPDSITSIADFAFSNCYALKSVEIPGSVKTLGNSVFSECDRLSSVSLTNGIESIGEYAFYLCQKLTEINIPESVTEIGDMAFSYCGFSSIIIPENVKIIGNGAFRSCANLESVEISDGVTDIGDNAFSGCKKLTSIEIPAGVTSIGRGTFDGCTKLLSINVVDNNNYYTSADGILFNKDKTTIIQYPIGKADTEYVVPAEVITIDAGAFSGCMNLTSVIFSDSVTGIGASAFSNCGNLLKLELPESVTDIGDSAFTGCHCLESVKIPGGVTKIGVSTFEFCDSLVSVEIPEGVTSIGENAFYFCLSLKNVTIPGSVKNIDYGAFSECENLEAVTLSDGLISINRSAFNGCKKLTSINIPISVENIGEYAFYGCPDIKSVKIPVSVKNIGDSAFGFYYDETTFKMNLVEGFTIYGVKGTVAESYAQDNGLAFVELKEICSHTDFSWIIDKDSTCTEKGSKHKECTVCGETLETVELIANGHTAVTDKAVEATCTEAGKTEGSHCSVCNAVIKAQETVAAKGHTASSWITDKKATVNSEGKKHKECRECGEILETAKIAQLKCSKPKLKSIENTEYGVLTKWSSVSGADKYYVYRKTGSSGKYSRIGSTTKTYYTDKTAKSGNKYYYIVKAINEVGSSDSSSSKSIYYLADTTLSTPKSTKSGVTLKWSKVTGADGYMVYRKTGTGSYSRIATVKGNSKVAYTDKSAKKGKTYTYKIKAYKSKTYSAYSNAKKIKDKY